MYCLPRFCYSQDLVCKKSRQTHFCWEVKVRKMLINRFPGLLGSRGQGASVKRKVRRENRAVVLAVAMETSWLVLGEHILF